MSDVDRDVAEDRDSALEKTSGYLKRSTVIRLATQAGFKLVAESQVNANPKDPADGPVWRLPPTLRNKDKDRAKYEAIGESDRMTLKFVKVAPKAAPKDAAKKTADAAPKADAKKADAPKTDAKPATK